MADFSSIYSAAEECRMLVYDTEHIAVRTFFRTPTPAVNISCNLLRRFFRFMVFKSYGSRLQALVYIVDCLSPVSF